MASPKKLSIVEEAITDLNAYADALEAGGSEEAQRRHTARRVKLPPPPTVTAEHVMQARELLGASQAVLAHLLGVTPGAVRAWEQRTRVPAGAAGRMLCEIVATPDHWRKRLAHLAASEPSTSDKPASPRKAVLKPGRVAVSGSRGKKRQSNLTART